MTATIIAFEGIDGSGKGTQSSRLVEQLRAEGRRAELLSFPRYSATRFGKAIGDFLNGRFGSLDVVSPFLASVLYAGDRFESRDMLLAACETNDVLVLDRYVASNIAHQGAKADLSEREELVEWIEAVEYDVFSLPRAEVTVLLDVTVPAAQMLIRQKARRDYTDQAADLHEADTAYMSRVRDCYRELAARDGWLRVSVDDEQGVRSVDDIAAEIRAAVSGRLSAD